MFKKRHNIKEVEEGKYLSPKFDENGLIPVITTDFQTGDILMHGYMNVEALKKTIETKEAQRIEELQAAAKIKRDEHKQLEAIINTLREKLEVKDEDKN